jgi:hypothetical protein
MSIGHFVDKESPRLPLWEQRTRFVADSYQMTGEWGYGSKN